MKTNNQVMPRVNGKHFRCSCGCNVFTEYEPLKYRCNSCDTCYQGEKEKEDDKRNKKTFL